MLYDGESFVASVRVRTGEEGEAKESARLTIEILKVRLLIGDHGLAVRDVDVDGRRRMPITALLSSAAPTQQMQSCG